MVGHGRGAGAVGAHNKGGCLSLTTLHQSPLGGALKGWERWALGRFVACLHSDKCWGVLRFRFVMRSTTHTSYVSLGRLFGVWV